MKKAQRYLTDKIGLKNLLVMSCPPATTLAFIYISLDAGGQSRWGNREATLRIRPGPPRSTSPFAALVLSSTMATLKIYDSGTTPEQ